MKSVPVADFEVRCATRNCATFLTSWVWGRCWHAPSFRAVTGRSENWPESAPSMQNLIPSIAWFGLLTKCLWDSVGAAWPCGRSCGEKKHRHGCRSDNKREVTAWESSTNQNAQMHKTTRKTRAMRCKSYTSRTQPLERWSEGEQANNKHFSLFLSRTNQIRKNATTA